MKKENKQTLKVMIGIILGIISGVILKEKTAYFEPLGIIFIKMLRMITIPIIFTSILTSITHSESLKEVGKIASSSIKYFAITTAAAILIGIAVSDITMGIVNAPPLTNTITAEPKQNTLPESDIQKNESISAFILQVIPDNLFKAVAQENNMAVIFFAILFSTALLKFKNKNRVAIDFFDSIHDSLMTINGWIIYLSPIGAFALISTAIGKFDIVLLKYIVLYIFIMLLAITVHGLGFLTIFLRLKAKINPLTFIKKMVPSLTTGFTTSSSSATLPITIDCLKNAEIPETIAKLVPSIGSSINMNGTALHKIVSVIFIAGIYGIKLSFYKKLILGVMSCILTVGTAAIPGSGIITMFAVFRYAGLPSESIVIVLAVDRILDMLRTVVNVFGNECSAAAVANDLKNV